MSGLYAATLPWTPNARRDEGGPSARRVRAKPSSGVRVGGAPGLHRDGATGVRLGPGTLRLSVGDFTFTAAIVKDEKGQAGVTEETPCLGRLWRAGKRNKGRVLQAAAGTAPGRKGRRKWEHVWTTAN